MLLHQETKIYLKTRSFSMPTGAAPTILAGISHVGSQGLLASLGAIRLEICHAFFFVLAYKTNMICAETNKKRGVSIFIMGITSRSMPACHILQKRRGGSPFGQGSLVLSPTKLLEGWLPVCTWPSSGMVSKRSWPRLEWRQQFPFGVLDSHGWSPANSVWHWSCEVVPHQLQCQGIAFICDMLFMRTYKYCQIAGWADPCHENGTCVAEMDLRNTYFTDVHWSYIPISSSIIWYHIISIPFNSYHMISYQHGGTTCM